MIADPPRNAGLPPGYDENDPYEDEDLSEYPDWWRRNIEEFRKFGMRPYRPPRLADGTISPPLIDELEAKHDVDIWLRSYDPEAGKWELIVDGESVLEFNHERDGGGYSVYEITKEKFEKAVREATRS